MSKVIHGGNIYQYSDKLIDFSSNINPLGIPGSAKVVLNESWEHLERYPDLYYTSLRNAIANHHQLDADQIIVGNGAAEIIFLMGRLFQNKKVLIPMPTFGEYRQAVELGGGQVEIVYRDSENDFSLPINKILDNLNHVDGVILCHPNNPTGKLVAEDNLVQIVEKTRQLNKMLILDEAFIDFAFDSEKKSGLKWLKSHPQMMIIRAFTKFYAMPGLRLGYGLGSSQLIERLHEMQIPWSVNSLAVEIGIRILQDIDYLQRSKDWIFAEREYFTNALRKLPDIQVYPTDANFILCKIQREDLNVGVLKARMIDEGILIRDASSFAGLDNSYFRVAIKDHENNKYLCQALEKSLKIDQKVF
ncbi:MAG: threonine-phosphate decarboxylase [Halanaerobiales bacterium]|nr:threonine-phosphate decarboxylase [Halanaerobiales bacterium]